jgi:hypothetical protein
MEIGSLGFGIYSAVFGVGSLASSLAIARWQPTAVGRLLPWFVLCAGALMIAFSLSTWLPFPLRLTLPALAAVGLGAMQTSFFSLSRALLLSASPAHLHARVISLLSFDRAFMSAGAAAGGMLAGAVGVQLAVIGYGSAALAGGLAMLGFGRSFRSATTAPSAQPEPEPVAAAEAALPRQAEVG